MRALHHSKKGEINVILTLGFTLLSGQKLTYRLIERYFQCSGHLAADLFLKTHFMGNFKNQPLAWMLAARLPCSVMKRHWLFHWVGLTSPKRAALPILRAPSLKQAREAYLSFSIIMTSISPIYTPPFSAGEKWECFWGAKSQTNERFPPSLSLSPGCE